MLVNVNTTIKTRLTNRFVKIYDKLHISFMFTRPTTCEIMVFVTKNTIMCKAIMCHSKSPMVWNIVSDVNMTC